MLAAVIFHSCVLLVGINFKTHSKLRYDTMERWVSDVHKRMTNSIALGEFIPKVNKAIGNIYSSL